MSSILSVIQLFLILVGALQPKFISYTTPCVILLAPCVGFTFMLLDSPIYLQIFMWVLQTILVATSLYSWKMKKVTRR